MPRIDKWANLPPAVRQHLIDRMRDRAIGYKDFGSFKICGNGSVPKTFLLRGQAGKGKAL